MATVVQYRFDWRYFYAMLVGDPRVLTADQDMAESCFRSLLPPFPGYERHVEALINKGGSVSPNHEEGGGIRPQFVQLRLPRALVQRIDKVRKHRLVVPSRHMWLLEALLEKLETEEHQKVS